MMKKLLSVLCVVILLLSFSSCDLLLDYLSEEPDLVEYNGTVYDKAQWTILVYMNGSNLESDGGLATGDIAEMVGAQIDSDDVRIIIQTGGTIHWSIEGIPGHNIGRMLVDNGDLQTLEISSPRSIGDAGNLSSFIDFGMKYFPAERYGIILWNHGGGSVSGFGADEWYDGDGLTLKELDDAFARSKATTTKFDFVGFDACLMASAETAWILRNYAHYLVASEEVEPGYGWDYLDFLNKLGQNPGMETTELCRNICDAYVNYYLDNDMAYEVTTLSAIDLSRIGQVVSALDAFTAAAKLSKDSYRSLAKLRAKTHEYGMPAENDFSFDMIDIADMANQYYTLLPKESEALLNAVESAVSYKAQNADSTIAGGISLYFPFSQPDRTTDRIDVYRNCGFSENYINFTIGFAELLTGETIAPFTAEEIHEVEPVVEDGRAYVIQLTQDQLDNIQAIYFTAWALFEENIYAQIYQDAYVEITEDGKILTEFDGIITTINGEWACLYEIESGEGYIRYAVPAMLNGVEVNLILLYQDGADSGRILGAMATTQNEFGMAPKRMIPIKDGDEIMLVYYAETFVDVDDTSESDTGAYLYEGTPFTVKGDLLVEDWEVLEGEYLYGFLIVDLQGNEYYTDFVVVNYDE